MISKLSDLPRIRSANSDKCIVLACGTFDILHAGHIDYLNWARSQGDILVVATPDDKSVRQEKGSNRPINNELDRLKIINSLKAVDYVVLTAQYGAMIREIGRELRPDVFVLYKDWLQEDIDELERLFPDSKVMIDIQDKANSSSTIIAKLAD